MSFILFLLSGGRHLFLNSKAARVSSRKNAKLRILHTYISTWKKKNQEILDVLKYKPLYNTSRSEKWDKKIQAAAYNGARMVNILLFSSHTSIPRVFG